MNNVYFRENDMTERDPVVRAGDTVRVRCAGGATLIKTAVTDCVDGMDFPVVWVAPLGTDWRQANQDARPWPVEDVEVLHH